MLRRSFVQALAIAASVVGLPLGNALAQTPAPSMAAGVDQSPLPVKVQEAFPKVKFDRPVVVTHAGDGTNRIFVLGQRGMIWVMPNDPGVTEPSVFLEMEDKVAYDDKMNEEGLLGLAFHPKFKENGQFFLYYTSKSEPHLSVISRFKTTDKSNTKSDVKSEEVLMTVKQPFWNHNGGNARVRQGRASVHRFW